MKALIVASFHRYLPAPAENQPEVKQSFPAGKTVAEGEESVTADDIADWIAKGLAKAAE